MAGAKSGGRLEGNQIEARSTIGGRGKRTPVNTPLLLSWLLCKFVRGKDYTNTGFPGNNFKT